MLPAKTPAITYGSDKNGLVWAYQFAADMPPREIESDSVANWLAAPAVADTARFLRLHFSLSNTGAERWLRQSLQLPDSFYESLRESVGSTRLEQAGDALVAVIHDVMFDASFDSSSVSTVTLAVTPRLVVSARLRPLRSVDRLRAAVRAGQMFRSTAELLAHLLRDQAEVLVEIVRQSTSRVDAIEDRVLAGRVAINRAELSTLRRTLVRLHGVPIDAGLDHQARAARERQRLTGRRGRGRGHSDCGNHRHESHEQSLWRGPTQDFSQCVSFPQHDCS